MTFTIGSKPVCDVKEPEVPKVTVKGREMYEYERYFDCNSDYCQQSATDLEPKSDMLILDDYRFLWCMAEGMRQNKADLLYRVCYKASKAKKIQITKYYAMGPSLPPLCHKSRIQIDTSSCEESLGGLVYAKTAMVPQ